MPDWFLYGFWMWIPMVFIFYLMERCPPRDGLFTRGEKIFSGISLVVALVLLMLTSVGVEI